MTIHVTPEANAEARTNKDQPNGYAGLDPSGLLKVAELPVALTDATTVVNVKYPPVGTLAAKGDGVTNDSAAIQACHDLLTNGGTLFFPAGTYLYGSAIYPRSNVRWLGASAGSVTLKSSGSTTCVSTDAGASYSYTNPLRNVAFENLGFDLNGVNSDFASFLNLIYANNVWVHDCLFTNSNAPSHTDSIVVPANTNVTADVVNGSTAVANATFGSGGALAAGGTYTVVSGANVPAGATLTFNAGSTAIGTLSAPATGTQVGQALVLAATGFTIQLSNVSRTAAPWAGTFSVTDGGTQTFVDDEMGNWVLNRQEMQAQPAALGTISPGYFGVGGDGRVTITFPVAPAAGATISVTYRELKQFLYVNVKNSSNCFVENNVFQGGRCSMGHPGNRIVVRDNLFQGGNDNMVAATFDAKVTSNSVCAADLHSSTRLDNLSLTSGHALVAGGTYVISGTNIPLATTLTFDAGSIAAGTLSQPATASPTGQTVNLANPQDFTTDIEFTGNIIRNPTGYGIYVGADGQNTTDANAAFYRIKICDNIITGNFTTGILSTAASSVRGVQINNNVITRTGADLSGGVTTGITLDAVSTTTVLRKGVSVCGNIVTGTIGLAGIQAGNLTGFVISQNLLYDIAVRGIRINAPLSAGRIDGNTINNVQNPFSHEFGTLTSVGFANNMMIIAAAGQGCWRTISTAGAITDCTLGPGNSFSGPGSAFSNANTTLGGIELHITDNNFGGCAQAPTMGTLTATVVVARNKGWAPYGGRYLSVNSPQTPTGNTHANTTLDGLNTVLPVGAVYAISSVGGSDFSAGTTFTVGADGVSGTLSAAALTNTNTVALKLYNTYLSAASGPWQRILVNDTTAFTVGAPINVPSAASSSQELAIEIHNGSGTTSGTITWNAIFNFGPTGTTFGATLNSGKSKVAFCKWVNGSWLVLSMSAQY